MLHKMQRKVKEFIGFEESVRLQVWAETRGRAVWGGFWAKQAPAALIAGQRNKKNMEIWSNCRGEEKKNWFVWGQSQSWGWLDALSLCCLVAWFWNCLWTPLIALSLGWSTDPQYCIFTIVYLQFSQKCIFTTLLRIDGILLVSHCSCVSHNFGFYFCSCRCVLSELWEKSQISLLTVTAKIDVQAYWQ